MHRKLGWKDSNLWYSDPNSDALPLGYIPFLKILRIVLCSIFCLVFYSVRKGAKCDARIGLVRCKNGLLFCFALQVQTFWWISFSSLVSRKHQKEKKHREYQKATVVHQTEKRVREMARLCRQPLSWSYETPENLFSEWQDLNPRHPVPKTGALPSCATLCLLLVSCFL